ncbi:MAG TPA: anion transporter [Acetobacteraceae bacterium]|jgi:Na+/H+ antiporter NhaD/arsenite permease-like protein
MRGTLSLLAIGVLLVLAIAAAFAPLLMPTHDGTTLRIAVAAIFAASYLALAIGKVPGLTIDRAGVALVGACLMVASGAMPLDAAYKAIDFGTITLLLGMMIVVANLRLSGFFALANAWVARHARRPLLLLIAIVAVSGLFSAFLVNDAICLVMAPLVVELTVGLRRNPVPYLLGVAMASNVGSVATITGNPQNIMIGSVSRIPYASFAGALTPVALIGLVLTVLLIVLLHRTEFRGNETLSPHLPRIRANRFLVLRSLGATAIVVALFFAGQPPAKAAIIIGALLLLTRRVKSARVYAEIDWSLLLMFTGLFILVAAAEHVLLTPDMVRQVGTLHLDSVPILAAVTAVLSNLVSNVPAVLLLKPFVVSLPDQSTAWLTVAMASTLAGNFTVLGSIANLIVVEQAARRGVRIGFGDYFRVGAPLTVLTIVIGTLWLMR